MTGHGQEPSFRSQRYMLPNWTFTTTLGCAGAAVGASGDANDFCGIASSVLSLHSSTAVPFRPSGSPAVAAPGAAAADCRATVEHCAIEEQQRHPGLVMGGGGHASFVGQQGRRTPRSQGHPARADDATGSDARSNSPSRRTAAPFVCSAGARGSHGVRLRTGSDWTSIH